MIANTNPFLGGSYLFLGVLYLVVGGLCFLVASLMVAVHVKWGIG